MEQINASREYPLNSLTASYCRILGIDPPKEAAAPCDELVDYALSAFGGKTADRIFLYNPDAIARYIAERYADYLSAATELTEFSLPLRSVYPSVTPVCFGTIYTGAQPAVHGIQKYEKPVIRIDTIFDALIRQGKKPVIFATTGCSMSKIFLEREMDYGIFKTAEEVNAHAVKAILEDQYDFVVVYNGNYDSVMHKYGPEASQTLAELRTNAAYFATFSHLIRENWTKHRTFLGFGMDHGCHLNEEGKGKHGKDIPEDMEITHHYLALPERKEES